MIHDAMILHFDQIPAGTAQQKRYDGRSKRFFKSKTLQQTEDAYMSQLFEYRPQQPLQGAVSLHIEFMYSIKDKKKKGKWKTSKPDVDNVAKLLIDCMTRCGFWVDDSQVVILRLAKRYTIQDEASIHIYYREVFDDE